MAESRGLRDIFIAFEGGGAKGLAHVGALRGLKSIADELEQQGVELNVAGVAGTSAGAIVAALFAAGYSADEIIDPMRRNSLLQCPALAPLQLRSAAELLGARALRSHALDRLECDRSIAFDVNTRSS